MITAILGLALVAHATISSLQPTSGEGEPGDTVSTVVTVSTVGLLTSCIAATSDTPLVITFDSLVTKCDTGTWFATMTVVIPATTPPGAYTVTVREINLGGSLLGTHPWPLMVTAPATTTTLLPEVTLPLPTITLPPLTTSTTTTTTTTTGISSTTSLAQASTVTNAGVDSTSSTAGIGSGTEPTRSGESPSEPVAPQLAPATSPPDVPTAAEDAGDVDTNAPFSEIAISGGLIEVADRALPPVFAQAVLSPLVLLEVLLRALGRTGVGLLLPLGVTILAGFGLARRLRHDAEDLPDLDDFVEVPDEREDDRS